MTDMTFTCTCGDVLDEHDPETSECLAIGCPCPHYEDDGEGALA